MTKTFLLLPLVLFLAACATGQPVNVQQQLDSWIGQDTDTLVRNWGAPERSYNFKDGSMVLEYERNRVESYGGWNRPHGSVAIGTDGSALGIGLPLWMDEPRLDIRRCLIKIETGKNRVIRRTSFSGQNCAYAVQRGMGSK